MSRTEPPLRGLYRVGSIALGDYRPGSSDIDFVAPLDAAASVEATDRLAPVGRVREALAYMQFVIAPAPGYQA